LAKILVDCWKIKILGGDDDPAVLDYSSRLFFSCSEIPVENSFEFWTC